MQLSSRNSRILAALFAVLLYIYTITAFFFAEIKLQYSNDVMLFVMLFQVQYSYNIIDSRDSAASQKAPIPKAVSAVFFSFTVRALNRYLP